MELQVNSEEVLLPQLQAALLVPRDVGPPMKARRKAPATKTMMSRNLMSSRMTTPTGPPPVVAPSEPIRRRMARRAAMLGVAIRTAAGRRTGKVGAAVRHSGVAAAGRAMPQQSDRCGALA